MTITPKSQHRLGQQQYPLKPEAVEGISPVFQSLLKKGVIVPCENSPVRTPMLPVKKPRQPPAEDDWRFVQDLRAVNSSRSTTCAKFPSPHTIVSQILPETKFYSVVDLSNAFISVPGATDNLVCIPISRESLYLYPATSRLL